jgi:hypothetical protein
MSRAIIRLVCLWLTVWLAPAMIRAAEPEDITEKEEKEDLALFSQSLGFSLWDESYSVRTGVGYKDNVLLDDTNPNKSPFFLNGLDITVFRLPVDDWGLSLFVSGDDIRYWRDVGVGSEDTWLAGGKAQWNFAPDWHASFAAAYNYSAQVMDLLSGFGTGTQAPTKIIWDTITLRPGVQRDLGSNYWVELQMEGTRLIYDSPAFSSWRYGPKLIFGRKYGSHSDISLSYAILREPFDNEDQVEPDGTDLPGTQLRYLTQKVELAWHHYWDQKRVWESSTRLNFDFNRDNGPGYFDYRHYAAREQFDYNGQRWKVTASAGWQNYRFPYQNVSDTDLSSVYQNDLTLNLHLEQQIFRHLKLFADYEYDHTFSDDPTEHYVVNTVKGGTSWEF